MVIVDDLRALNKEQRSAFIASLLGWTLDAFDFFLLTFIIEEIARDFGAKVSTIGVAITLTLMLRPAGAFVFGWLADRFGRRPVLMADVLLFSVLELASAFAPNLLVLLVLRAAFGFAMGGEWGIGASLALESIPPKSRGVVSGLLQEGYALGFLLAALTFYAVSQLGAHHLLPRGVPVWRILFMTGVAPALLILYIRRHVPESPAWMEQRRKERVGREPAPDASLPPSAARSRLVLPYALHLLGAAGVAAWLLGWGPWLFLALPLGAATAYAIRASATSEGTVGIRAFAEHQIRLFWAAGAIGAIWFYLVALLGPKLQPLGLTLSRLTPVVLIADAVFFGQLAATGLITLLRGRSLAVPKPGGLWHAMGARSGLLVYVVVLMTGFNLFSHGTQDLYPTFLKVQHKFAPGLVTLLTVAANVGAILGGVAFGAVSERIGRRRAIVLAALIALPIIPLWAFAQTPLLLAVGAFLIQISVQGAWGVVPVHLNELSPEEARSTFPGFAYQLGNFIASGNAVVQARVAEDRHNDYAFALATVAGVVAVGLALLTFLGPEAKGKSFASTGAEPV